MTTNTLLRICLPAIIPALLVLCCSQQHNRAGDKASSGTENTGTHHDTTGNHDSLIDLQYLLGQFEPSTHPLFSKIDKELTNITEGYLRTEALEAFRKMHQAAGEENIKLTIVSATRNFNHQKRIWEAKWNGTTLVDGKDLRTVKDHHERARIILKYSSMPGTSRHHWGTDIDINSVNPEYFEKPEGKKVYDWLAENAGDYGFCQTYTKKDSLRKTGYEEEPWHWSYTPVSSALLNKYKSIVKPEDIKGFKGDKTVVGVRMIEEYVVGINPLCK